MAITPNYRQQKKQREQAKKQKHAEKKQRRAPPPMTGQAEQPGSVKP